MKGVPRLILLPVMNASHPLTMHATIRGLRNLNAVRRHLRAADEAAADPAPAFWTGALGAAVINKVGLSFLHFAILEPGVDAVVVLVAFTLASFVQTRSAASPAFQGFFNAVFKFGTFDGRAVGLALAHAQVEIQKSGSGY